MPFSGHPAFHISGFRIIRNPEVVQVLLKRILRSEACIAKESLFSLPFIETPPIIIELHIIGYDKGSDV